MTRRTSRRIARRTSRPLTRNVKPSVARPIIGHRSMASPALTQWIAITFAPGTPVKFLQTAWTDAPLATDTKYVLPSSRGEVVRFDGVYLQVRVVDSRDENGRQEACVGHTVSIRDIFVDEILEPLVDNWPTAQSKYRRSGKITPNTIPPAPHWRDWDDFTAWAKKTYAVGTRVRLIEDRWAMGEDDNLLPSGSIGRVISVSGNTGVTVEFVKQIPLFTSTSTTTLHTMLGFSGIEEHLEPLDDNWGPLVIPSKRHSPPPQRGWQKQLAQSRRYRAMKPNANRRVSQRGGSDMRRIEDAAREQGWSVDQTRRGHLVFISPDKSVPPVHTGSDVGDPRALKNIEARLRRAGLEIGKRHR